MKKKKMCIQKKNYIKNHWISQLMRIEVGNVQGTRISTTKNQGLRCRFGPGCGNLVLQKTKQN